MGQRAVVVGIGVWALVLSACGTDGGNASSMDTGIGGLATAGHAGVSATQAGGASGIGGASAMGGTQIGGTASGAGTAGVDATGGAPADAGAANVTTGGTEAQGGSSGTGGDTNMAGENAGGNADGPTTSAPCGNVASGSQTVRVRYRDLHVSYGTACESEEQQATCTDGVLGAWSGTFVQESCSAFPPGDCETAAHGAYAERTRFAAASVAYGQQCKSEQQRALCANGALGAWSGSYAFEDCTVQPPADCGATAHGSYAKRTRYYSAQEPFGSECSAQEQQALCTNGTLGAWSGSFTFDVCVVGPAADCDGASHGTSEQRTRYEVTSVPFGETCPKEVQTHTCDNGFWTPWSGEYLYDACEIASGQPCDGQPHGTVQSWTTYAEYSVEYGESCLSEVRTRVCNDGVWSDWTGSYEAASCKVQECAAGMTQSRSCGLNNRGTQTRSCLIGGPLDGAWDPNWGACVDPDVCKDGASVPPAPCNGGLGWEPRTCVNGQHQLSGTCGACSGTFVDPCLENKTSDSCFAAKYEGLKCGGWVGPLPHCVFSAPFATHCYDFHESSICTPTFGCSWSWQ